MSAKEVCRLIRRHERTRKNHSEYFGGTEKKYCLNISMCLINLKSHGINVYEGEWRRKLIDCFGKESNIKHMKHYYEWFTKRTLGHLGVIVNSPVFSNEPKNFNFNGRK